ncbi:hypothetical protein M0R45_035714 [Rubus argutus]|uniref:Uncharacterized protein n=1 Tax=Rubus argutus TaxID=59490 RepID=A0AAW1VXR3_RUBAR
MHNGSDQSLQMVRCAALSSECNTICYGGSLTSKGYAGVYKELAKVKVLDERLPLLLPLCRCTAVLPRSGLPLCPTSLLPSPSITTGPLIVVQHSPNHDATIVAVPVLSPCSLPFDPSSITAGAVAALCPHRPATHSCVAGLPCASLPVLDAAIHLPDLLSHPRGLSPSYPI